MPNPDGTLTYYETLTAAVNDIAAHGYDSEERVAYWSEQIRRAAMRSLRPEAEVEAMVREGMMAVFNKQVNLGGALRNNPAVSAFTLQQIRPELHAELQRRIAASVDLIKLNRPQAILKTQQRFRGWATSVPKGGAKGLKRVKQKQELRKALASLPFEERRVIIDQNAKLASSINTTIATNGGAIGARWSSHKHQIGYDGRPAHNARDDKFFVYREGWAYQSGLIKTNANGFTDEVEQPAELPFCRCSWQWIFSLRSVPTECLTVKGEQALREARSKVIAHG